MPPDSDERAPDVPLALDERVLSTLQGLRGSIAFNGLRRALRAHPESLSRSLRRLEREGRIERSHGGYRALGEVPDRSPHESTHTRSIAQVELPPGVTPDQVSGRLIGRWFGSLRWVGVVDDPDGRLLAWAKRDGGGHVLLGIQRGVLRVFAREDPARDDPDESEEAAYELLSHAVAAVRPIPRGREGPTTLTLFGAESTRFRADADN